MPVYIKAFCEACDSLVGQDFPHAFMPVNPAEREEFERWFEPYIETMEHDPCPGCGEWAVTVLGLEEGEIPDAELPEMSWNEWVAAVEQLLKESNLT
jgi:hypothetical protein